MRWRKENAQHSVSSMSVSAKRNDSSLTQQGPRQRIPYQRFFFIDFYSSGSEKYKLADKWKWQYQSEKCYKEDKKVFVRLTGRWWVFKGTDTKVTVWAEISRSSQGCEDKGGSAFQLHLPRLWSFTFGRVIAHLQHEGVGSSDLLKPSHTSYGSRDLPKSQQLVPVTAVARAQRSSPLG